ncbi:MAG TPA: deoxyribose-phosphate aldolase [bacterium]|nr:deoxyribose-phosphate aldolase [bacterium]
MHDHDTILARAKALSDLTGAGPERYAVIAANLIAVWEPPTLTAQSVPGLIDHTLLAFDATEKAIEQLCADAARHRFKAVCVNPVWVATAREMKRRLGARYAIAAVVDFPLGASTIAARRAEAQTAIADGATELDLVIGIGLLKSGRFAAVYEGIRCAAGLGAYLKVILETSALTEAEKVDGALLAVLAGADMLKTSTGVNGKATPDDVRLLRTVAGTVLGVKAAGGIRDRATFERMVAAGADRIGSSASCGIMEEWG